MKSQEELQKSRAEKIVSSLLLFGIWGCGWSPGSRKQKQQQNLCHVTKAPEQEK